MTRKKKKTTIITETDRLLILNRHSGAVEGWCDDLSDFAGMVGPDDAVEWAAFRLGSASRAAGLKELPGVKTAVPAEDRLDRWVRPA